MRKGENVIFNKREYYSWKPWFAWYPVWLFEDNREYGVWLENIERCYRSDGTVAYRRKEDA